MITQHRSVRHNDGVHIENIINTTSCKSHEAPEGDPCWSTFITTTKKYAPSVCGKRIRAAGFNGKIDAKSLSQKAPGGRNEQHKSRARSA